MIKPIAGLLFFGLCLSSAAQAVPEFCEHPYPKCSLSQYAIKEDRCDNTKCQSLAIPPNTPNVYCTYVGSGYDCAIWPRGPDLSYTYAASGPITVSDTGPTYQSNVWVQCGVPARPGGVLSVTATSPAGLNSPMRNIVLSCRDQQEH